ncbi:MAG: TIGR03768 family metallophosphoesterase [Burkholderiales bacterium]
MTDQRFPDPAGDGDPDFSRRSFLCYSATLLAATPLAALTAGCGGGSGGTPSPQRYPIDPDVRTTLDRMLAFPAAKSPGLPPQQLDAVSQYAALGYGDWKWGSGLPAVARYDLMPTGYAAPAAARARLARFFTFSDIHITDKEAPNQLIYLQQYNPTQYANAALYSPVMMYTTQVLDAAMQTVNVLHRRDPFDFGISLGDTCNCTSYNELRWYIDVIDGKVVRPSSGAHLGENTIDYQRPFQAAGLDPSIRWYQCLGNHDHFYLGSFPVDAEPALGLRDAFVADTVWNGADVLITHICDFPQLVDMRDLKGVPRLYMGVFDGSSPYGAVTFTGRISDPAYASGPPRVAPDPDRRSLLRQEWVQEFFDTTTLPRGHGFDRIDPALRAAGFACYSFVPNAAVPLKIIVLDDTQSEADGSRDIHGHAYLDAARWTWLQAELAQGQADDQLMIVAAHCPIAVSAIGSETEWWTQTDGIDPAYRNAVTLKGLVETLWNTPNLLAWVAGHRHLNVVKALKPYDPPGRPEQAFWQVETSSLREWPQQFRTFEVVLNDDYTVAIVTTNVDPSVAEGTPAATSRRYAIATQQIVQKNVNLNVPNVLTTSMGCGTVSVPSMDPSRVQTDAKGPAQLDASIQFTDMTTPSFDRPVPVNGSYNGRLYKQLSPRMVAVLKAKFPPAP